MNAKANDVNYGVDRRHIDGYDTLHLHESIMVEFKIGDKDFKVLRRALKTKTRLLAK